MEEIDQLLSNLESLVEIVIPPQPTIDEELAISETSSQEIQTQQETTPLENDDLLAFTSSTRNTAHLTRKRETTREVPSEQTCHARESFERLPDFDEEDYNAACKLLSELKQQDDTRIDFSSRQYIIRVLEQFSQKHNNANERLKEASQKGVQKATIRRF